MNKKIKFFLERSSVLILISVFSIICYLTIILLLHIRFQKNIYPDYFFHTYYISVFISILIIIFIPHIKSNSLLAFLFLFRFLFIVIMCYPIEHSINFELLLYTSLILEIGFFLKWPLSIFLSIVIIFLSFLLTNPNQLLGNVAFGFELSQKSLDDNISLYTYIIILSFISSVLNKYYLLNIEFSDDINHLEKAIDQLSLANIDFQEYAKEVNKISKLDERKRISRDIHDIVGHNLTNIKALIEVAIGIGNKNPDKLIEIYYNIRDQAQEGLNKTREALRELRKEDTKKISTLRNIKKLVETFSRATDINVRLESGNIPWSFEREFDFIIYHIIQEGLTNSFRHGKATSVIIYLWQSEEELIINIGDNGKGASQIKKGIGLSGMEERLSRFGGKLEIVNAPLGFQLTAYIPIINRIDYEKNKDIISR